MSETDRLLEGSQSGDKVILYNRRWVMAFLIGLQTTLVRFFMNSIGIVNNVYAGYFDVTIVAVDWLTIVQYPGSLIGNFVIALLIFNGKVGIRNLSIAVGVCFVFACSSFLTASLFHLEFLYSVLYISEFLLGGCYVTLFTIITQLANYWFPEREVGAALLFVPLMGGIGAVMAFIIPSNVLKTPPKQHELVENAHQTMLQFQNQSKNSWREFDEKAFLGFSGCSVAISILALVFNLIFMQDHPPTPATKAQVKLRKIQLRKQSGNSAPTSICSNMTAFLKESKRILFNDVIIYICLIGMLRFGFISIQIIFFGELTRPLFDKITLLKNHDGLSGIVLGSYEATMTVGVLASGKLNDLFQKHLLCIRLSFLCSFLAFLGTMLGIYFSNVIVVWCFYVVVGFAIGIPFMPLYDTAVQHMFPAKPGLIMALISLVMYSGSPVAAQSSRLLLKYGGELALMIFALLLFLAALLLSLALKPDFKRFKLNAS